MKIKLGTKAKIVIIIVAVLGLMIGGSVLNNLAKGRIEQQQHIPNPRTHREGIVLQANDTLGDGLTLQGLRMKV